MSNWLARALAADVYRSGVPIAPKAPIAEPEPASGTNDANGTALIYKPREAPAGARPVAPGGMSGEIAAWREALLALSPDRDPCPGWRPGAWVRVRAHGSTSWTGTASTPNAMGGQL
jgi:hypothetical protein